MNKKVVIGIVAVIAVLTGVAIYAITFKNASKQMAQPVTPTPVTQKKTTSNQPVAPDIANWKVYSNDAYGFSMKYPSALGVKETVHSKETMSTEVISETVGHTVFDLAVAKDPQADVINIGLTVTIQKLENAEFLFPAKMDGQISRQETIIDGKKAVKYVYKGMAFLDNGQSKEDAVNVNYEVENNGFVYSFSSFGADPNFGKMLDQMMTTVKFSGAIK